MTAIGFDVAADLCAPLASPSPRGVAGLPQKRTLEELSGKETVGTTVTLLEPLLRGPLEEALSNGNSSSRDAFPRDTGDRGEFLRALDARPEVIAQACGDVAAATGESFPCVLGAAHRGGSARVELRENRVVYVCDCDEFERTLIEVYARRMAEIPRAGRLSKGEFVCWKVRLVLEAGVLDSPLVALPPLPADATKYALRVHEGLRLFVAVRTLTDKPGKPFPFARSFAAEWCGLGLEQANAGIKSLVRAGVLVKVGSVPAGPYKANLYVVGTGGR